LGGDGLDLGPQPLERQPLRARNNPTVTELYVIRALAVERAQEAAAQHLSLALEVLERRRHLVERERQGARERVGRHRAAELEAAAEDLLQRRRPVPLRARVR